MAYNTTGLAVGLAIGIPCVIILIIASFFWYRGAKKFQKELDEEGTTNNAKDVVDLDEISISRVDAGRNKLDHRSGTLNKMNSDVSLLHSSELDETAAIRSSSGNISELNIYDYYIPTLPPQRPSNNHSSNGSLSSGSPSAQEDLSKPNFMRRISKSIRKPSSKNSTNIIEQQQQDFIAPPYFNSDSHSSINTDYIKQLNKNDSSSFPLTTHTLANASNHAINVYNNFNSSRSNSGLQIYNNNSSLKSDPLLSNFSSSSSSKLKKSNSSSNLLEQKTLPNSSPLSQSQARTHRISTTLVDSDEDNEIPFDNSTATPRFSQYIDTTTQQQQQLPNVADNNEDDSGIIEDDGYTNYDNNKKRFLNSLRP